MRWAGVAGVGALAGLLAVAAGCGGSSGLAVKGRVTLDGAPVENGSISFFAPGNGPRAAAAVEGGEYVIPAAKGLTPGAYRVEVTWLKPTGRKIPSKDPGMTADETREAIPAKYNTASTLTADLSPGENVKDFPLTR